MTLRSVLSPIRIHKFRLEEEEAMLNVVIRELIIKIPGGRCNSVIYLPPT